MMFCVFLVSERMASTAEPFFLLHSAMGRLGVHKSFIVDVTLHFGSSNPYFG